MNDELSDWEIYVGRLIISFGSIELLTFKLFEIWIPDKKTTELTLTQRLDNLIGHISRIKDDDERRYRIKALFIRTKQLNTIRNQLAHNPTILEKYNDFEYKNVVADMRGEESTLNIAQVHEFADEARSIASKLIMLVSQYTKRCVTQFITDGNNSGI